MDWELLILLMAFAGCFFCIGYIQGKKKPIYYVDYDHEFPTGGWQDASPERMAAYEKEVEEALGPDIHKFNTETVEDFLGRTHETPKI